VIDEDRELDYFCGEVSSFAEVVDHLASLRNSTVDIVALHRKDKSRCAVAH
jgi:hypothetical protein